MKYFKNFIKEWVGGNLKSRLASSLAKYKMADESLSHDQTQIMRCAHARDSSKLQKKSFK